MRFENKLALSEECKGCDLSVMKNGGKESKEIKRVCVALKTAFM